MSSLYEASGPNEHLSLENGAVHLHAELNHFRSMDQILSGVQAVGVTFGHLNTIQVTVTGGQFIDSNFEHCDLLHTKFEHCSFFNVAFTDCVLRNVEFLGCTFKDCRFELSDDAPHEKVAIAKAIFLGDDAGYHSLFLMRELEVTGSVFHAPVQPRRFKDHSENVVSEKKAVGGRKKKGAGQLSLTESEGD